MDGSIIKKLVEDQLARGETFINFHGIMPENVRSFLVEPFSVRTDPDDLETMPRDMWLVLQERPTPTEGFVVVYDPHTGNWGVAEHIRGGEYTLVNSARSLAEAIGSM
jgi:hypothetical protein